LCIDVPVAANITIHMASRDIVVVGASSGGLTAVMQLLGGLPRDVPAAIFVVIHSSRDNPGILPKLLEKAGNLPAAHAVSGEAIRHGHVYVPPPDRHLLLDRSGVVLSRGPREHRFRPAVDPLFRSAARAFGPRVVGVVLSGDMGDGTDGLRVIKHEGGVAVVQRADDAAFPDMPLSALSQVDVDHVEPASRLGELVDRLARESVVDQGPAVSSVKVRRAGNRNQRGAPLEPPSPFTCPECDGALWERADGDALAYCCHVGHRFSVRSLLEGQAEQIETALWSAVRALEDQATLRRRLAERFGGRARKHLGEGFAEEAREAEMRADTLRRLLLGATTPQPALSAVAKVSRARKARSVGEPNARMRRSSR